MRSPKRALDLAVLLPIGAVLLFVPPYVGLADGARTLLGIPSLHLYIFGVWGLGIVLTAVVARRLSALEDSGAEGEAPPGAGPPDAPGNGPGYGPAGAADPPPAARTDGDGI